MARGSESRGILSSLGRESVDVAEGVCRQRLLEARRIGHYAERGPGAIYWSGRERKGPSPLELVRLASGRYPELLQPAIARVKRLSEVAIEQILSRIPVDWMTDIAVDFVREFLDGWRKTLCQL
jgi:hypothetical protein